MEDASHPARDSIWTAPLRVLYDALSLPSNLQHVDAIFAFAGVEDRKLYALDLWREGWAPALMLSVGRFEWRRIAALGLPSDGGLRELVDATPPVERHFILTLDAAGARAERAERTSQSRFGTRAESRMLARIAAERGYRSILVVSTAAHLRRVAISTRRAIDPRTSLVFAAVPEQRASIRRADWWRSHASRAMVLTECVKLPVYALLPPV